MADARSARILQRYVLHPLEAAAAFAAYGLFAALPIGAASALGGWLAGAIGPRLGLSRRAVRNLKRAFPGISDAEVAAHVQGMWNNLGRVIGEHPHLHEFDFGVGGNAELVGGEHIDAVRDSGRGAIFVSGHIGNWELMPLAGVQRGLPVDVVYRAANNRMIDWLYRHGRSAVAGEQIPKGSAGARQVLRSLRAGRSLGMLVDQKMNDGVAVPFFGRMAMTAPAAADLAQKFGCPLLIVRMERLAGTRLRVTVLPPLMPESSGDRHADIVALTTRVNQQLEAWIRERPEQWLWLHNRWPDEDLPAGSDISGQDNGG